MFFNIIFTINYPDHINLQLLSENLLYGLKTSKKNGKNNALPQEVKKSEKIYRDVKMYIADAV